MASSPNKKVVLHRFDRPVVIGFISPRSYLQPEGIEILSPDGEVSVVPYEEIKTARFVKEFTDNDEPARRTFTTRPKKNGLWTRFHFRDGDTLDSILANNLTQLDGLGFQIYPPDQTAALRWFIPREALRDVQVLAVIGSPLRQVRKPRTAKRQIELFG